MQFLAEPANLLPGLAENYRLRIWHGHVYLVQRVKFPFVVLGYDIELLGALEFTPGGDIVIFLSMAASRSLMRCVGCPTRPG
jgi:hypothetical protein